MRTSFRTPVLTLQFAFLLWMRYQIIQATRRILLILLLLIVFSHSKSQDFNALLKEADRLEAVPDEKGAFRVFGEALKLNPLNVYVLTKCSELCSRIGNREKDHTSRDSYYKAALTYAKIAL